MATFVLTDAVVTVNAVDLSDWCTEVTINVEVDDQEDTAFGDTYRSRLGGLRDLTIDLGFNSDFAAGAVDATIWPLVGTTTAITVKATSAATSATNPLYSATVLVNEYSPLDGSVGDLSTTSVSWPGAGGAGLTRATA
jgi:hypothetical protein